VSPNASEDMGNPMPSDDKTKSYQREQGDEPEPHPLDLAEDEATIAPLREGLIVPPRQQEGMPADDDRRVAEGRPTRRSD
jgi:hypothetical protein